MDQGSRCADDTDEPVNLTEYLATEPRVDVDLEIERHRDPPREIDLGVNPFEPP
jgi:hypothetical protein